MNLYYISQSENDSYDTFDSAVVVAETEDEARKIHPWNRPVEEWAKHGEWASKPENVEVEFIGVAKEGTEKSVILSSFNAG